MTTCFFLIVALLANTAQSETPLCTQNEHCQCTQDELCQLECIGVAKCTGSNTILSCTPGYPCTITCSGTKACSSAKIYANGATTLALKCNGTKSCQYTELYCDTSICSIDCEAENTCDSIRINTDDAASFQCINTCPDAIPSPFIRTTAEPIHTISDTTIFSTETPSSTDQYQQTTSTNYVIKTLSKSDTTESTPTKASIFPSIYSSTPLSSNEPFVSTEATTNDQTHHHEQEVMVETTDIADIESNDDLESINNGYNIIGIDDIWIYIGIGGAVFCCLLIALIYVVGQKRKRTKELYVPKHHPVHKAIPSTTITMTPISQSISPVALTPATMTPVTPIKIRNLGVIKHDTQYKNTFPDTVNTGFSMYLANEALAGSMVMDDIVNDMVSTPGQFEVDLVVSPMEEGGGYNKDIYMEVNEDDEDMDDIVGDMNQIVKTNDDINDSDDVIDNMKTIQ